jgi:hypothetical protein
MAQSAIHLAWLPTRTKLGVKGPGVASWLAGFGLALPENAYDAMPATSLDWIIRYGAQEFFLAAPEGNPLFARLRANLALRPFGVYETPREEAEFLLRGTGARALLCQTCAIQFDAAPARRLICTRLAGVSCTILPDPSPVEPRYYVWIDPSYSHYLFETLACIVVELGGRVDAGDPSESHASSDSMGSALSPA